MDGDEVAFNTDSAIIKILITGELDIRPTYEYKAIIQKPYEPNNIRELIKKLTS